MMDELTFEERLEQEIRERDLNDPYRTMPRDFRMPERVEEDDEDEEEIRAFC